VPEKCLVAVIGPSGAGKSTLLAAMTGPERDRYRSRSRRASRVASGARAASRERMSTKNGASRAHAIRPTATVMLTSRSACTSAAPLP
jgi:ribose 1,5-bisphosphokinase PhnN